MVAVLIPSPTSWANLQESLGPLCALVTPLLSLRDIFLSVKENIERFQPLGKTSYYKVLFISQ